jgi:hypothetical protein
MAKIFGLKIIKTLILSLSIVFLVILAALFINNLNLKKISSQKEEIEELRVELNRDLQDENQDGQDLEEEGREDENETEIKNESETETETETEVLELSKSPIMDLVKDSYYDIEIKTEIINSPNYTCIYEVQIPEVKNMPNKYKQNRINQILANFFKPSLKEMQECEVNLADYNSDKGFKSKGDFFDRHSKREKYFTRKSILAIEGLNNTKVLSFLYDSRVINMDKNNMPTVNHPIKEYKSINIDLNEIKVLEFNNLFDPDEIDQVKQYAVQEGVKLEEEIFHKDKEISERDKEAMKERSEERIDWVFKRKNFIFLDKKGIKIFNIYWSHPFASLMIEIPYSVLKKENKEDLISKEELIPKKISSIQSDVNCPKNYQPFPPFSIYYEASFDRIFNLGKNQFIYQITNFKKPKEGSFSCLYYKKGNDYELIFSENAISVNPIAFSANRYLIYEDGCGSNCERFISVDTVNKTKQVFADHKILGHYEVSEDYNWLLLYNKNYFPGGGKECSKEDRYLVQAVNLKTFETKNFAPDPYCDSSLEEDQRKSYLKYKINLEFLEDECCYNPDFIKENQNRIVIPFINQETGEKEERTFLLGGDFREL